jgi:hypothetical protein
MFKTLPVDCKQNQVTHFKCEFTYCDKNILLNITLKNFAAREKIVPNIVKKSPLKKALRVYNSCQFHILSHLVQKL